MTAFLWYFAYGSNLLKQQMKDVLGRGNFESTKAVLKNHLLVFTSNGSGQIYASVRKSRNNKVYGVCFRITKKELRKMNRFEQKEFGGYELIKVKASSGNKKLEAYAFAMKENNGSCKPDTDYLGKVVIGLHQHKFNKKEVNDVLKKAGYL